MARVIGGRLISTFPRIRESFDRTVDALSCCEMLAQITADRVRALPKYELMCAALEAFDSGASPWLSTAFGFQLLSLAGFRVEERELSPAAHRLRETLESTDLTRLGEIAWHEDAASVLSTLLYDSFEHNTERPLRTRLFRESLALAAAESERQAVAS